MGDTFKALASKGESSPQNVATVPDKRRHVNEVRDSGSAGKLVSLVGRVCFASCIEAQHGIRALRCRWGIGMACPFILGKGSQAGSPPHWPLQSSQKVFKPGRALGWFPVTSISAHSESDLMDAIISASEHPSLHLPCPQQAAEDPSWLLSGFTHWLLEGTSSQPASGLFPLLLVTADMGIWARKRLSKANDNSITHDQLQVGATQIWRSPPLIHQKAEGVCNPTDSSHSPQQGLNVTDANRTFCRVS